MQSKRVPLTFIVFILLSSCVFSVTIFGEATAATKTAGPLNSDTAWTKTNSPYSLMGNIILRSISTLTIEPGATVNLNGYSLIINGTLDAQGTLTEKIQFNNGTIILDSNTTGSRIQNTIMPSSVSLVLISGSNQIDNNQIDSRIIVKGGSPSISNNLISDGIQADAAGGAVTITNNDIGTKSGFVGLLIMGTHGEVSGNKIFGNNIAPGISVSLRISSATIINNQILNCTLGLYSDAGGASENDVKVSHNLFFGNEVGVKFWDSIDLSSNTFVGNVVGLQCGPGLAAKVSYNNFQNNSQYNVENIHLGDLDATNNWWGTNNKTAIKQTLYHDDNYSGAIIFEPFLQTPDPNAPTIPTDPTPVPAIDDATGQVGFVWSQNFLPAAISGVVGVVLVIVAVFVWRKHKR